MSAPLINNLGGEAGFGESTLFRNDDQSTPAIDITSVFENGLNFFGQTYTSLYVNNNGNISFNQPIPEYTPFGISGSIAPMIAAFFADVDTRVGLVPASPGGTSAGNNITYYDLDPSANTFTVTYDDVGYFNQHTDRINAFQIQLLDQGSGDFDIIFRYENIEWTTGDASFGVGGLGGTVARAGYSAGNNINFFELTQSGDQSQMLSLEDIIGNTGEAGLWRFEVRNGVITPTITEISIREDFLTATVNQAVVNYTFERSGNLDYEVILDLDGSTTTPGFVFNDAIVTMPAGQSEVIVPVTLTGADGSTDVRFDFEIDTSDQYDTFIAAEVPGSEEAERLENIRDSIVIADGAAAGLFIGDDGVDIIGGRTFGDPHLITFDNVAYDFQAAGEFVLARATQGASYEVHIRTKPLSDAVSYIDAVATVVDGTRVSYDYSNPAAPVLRINGVETGIPAPGEAIAVGAGSITSDPSGLLLTHPSGETLLVTGFSTFLSLSLGIDESRPLGSFQGLLGNADGNPSNDLTLADGTVLSTPVPVETLYGAYANSWVLDTTTTLLDGPFMPYAPPGRTITVDLLPPDVLAAAIAAVDAAGIDNEILREAAILDFALTQDPSYIDAAVASDQIYDPIVDTVPVDETARALLSIATEQTSLQEGDDASTSFTFTVSRPESDLPVDVNYAVTGTGGNPADASDFAGIFPNGTVTFAAGETSKSITIDVSGDTTIEADESFAVNLSLGTEASQLYDILNGSAVAVITNDDIPPAVPIGEVGRVSGLTEQPITVTLANTYVNPVVIAQTPSFNGGEASVVRLDNITSNTFELFIVESSDKDGIHPGAEDVSYMVVEAGNYILADGSTLEAGEVSATNFAGDSFSFIDFGEGFDAAPVLMSQVQTNNEAGFLTTRHNAITADGAFVGMQEDEINTIGGSHVEETVGYVAIEQGARAIGSFGVEAATFTPPPQVDTLLNGRFDFSDVITNAPNVFASPATFVDADPFSLRYQDLSGDGVTIFAKEDISFDAEDNHFNEDIQILAIDGEGIITGFSSALVDV